MKIIFIILCSCLMNQATVSEESISLNYLLEINSFKEANFFDEPLSVFFNKLTKEVIMPDPGNHRVNIFSADGMPNWQIGKNKEVSYPFSAVADEEENIIVSEMNSGKIKVFDARGKHLEDMDFGKIKSDKDVAPGRLNIDSEGNIYAVDRANCQIIVFDKKREYKYKFGKQGNNKGEFLLIQDIAIDKNNNIYVTDSTGTPVQKFDNKGKYLMSFGKHGQNKDDFSFPNGLAVDKKNRLWIADSFKHEIKIFDANGNHIKSFGKYGLDKNELFFPVDLCFDETNKVFILEKGAKRIKVYEVK